MLPVLHLNKIVPRKHNGSMIHPDIYIQNIYDIQCTEYALWHVAWNYYKGISVAIYGIHSKVFLDE